MSRSKLGLVAVVCCLPLAAGIIGCSSDSQSAGAGGDGGSGGGGPKSCAEAASVGVRECIGLVNDAWATCYADDNAPCASDNANVGAALSGLQADLEASCSDGEFLSLSVDALVGRLQNSCRSEADSIAWRTYGGPHGA